ncbi:hypothetical protein [Halococcus sp. AFM35]|uniref:hypothetical protein n=1 Tax=Halococcus sp. AFM35 TaxID=3421653 RepID=UPI003EBA1808
MFGLSGFSALLGLADRASTQLEYWREYKGEKILIRSCSLDDTTDDERYSSTYRQTSYVIEGEIEAVMSFPPGFRLNDVTEYIYTSFFLSTAMHEEPELMNNATHYSKQNTRKIERKFVAFDAIEQIERAEDADEAIEPLRQNFESNPERNSE